MKNFVSSTGHVLFLRQWNLGHEGGRVRRDTQAEIWWGKFLEREYMDTDRRREINIPVDLREADYKVGGTESVSCPVVTSSIRISVKM
jgi:hypothetical protein